MNELEQSNIFRYFQKWTKITEDDKLIILSAFEPFQIKRKKDLLRYGEVCKHINFVVKGCLRSYTVDEKGNEHVTQIRMENNWISDLDSFFSKTPSTSYIEALEDSQLYRISKERLDELFTEVPALERYFCILFQKAYIDTQKRLNSTMREPAMDRYKKFIKKNPELFKRVPLVYIASYLGITPESLSRIRKQM